MQNCAEESLKDNAGSFSLLPSDPLLFKWREDLRDSPSMYIPQGQCGVYFLLSPIFKQLHWTVRASYMLPTKVCFKVTSWFLLKKRVKTFLLQQELLVTANALKLIHRIHFFNEKNVCRAMIQERDKEHLSLLYLQIKLIRNNNTCVKPLNNCSPYSSTKPCPLWKCSYVHTAWLTAEPLSSTARISNTSTSIRWRRSYTGSGIQNWPSLWSLLTHPHWIPGRARDENLFCPQSVPHRFYLLMSTRSICWPSLLLTLLRLLNYSGSVRPGIPPGPHYLQQSAPWTTTSERIPVIKLLFSHIRDEHARGLCPPDSLCDRDATGD